MALISGCRTQDPQGCFCFGEKSTFLGNQLCFCQENISLLRDLSQYSHGQDFHLRTKKKSKQTDALGCYCTLSVPSVYPRVLKLTGALELLSNVLFIPPSFFGQLSTNHHVHPSVQMRFCRQNRFPQCLLSCPLPHSPVFMGSLVLPWLCFLADILLSN